MKNGQIPGFKPSVGVPDDIRRLERPWGFRLQQDSKSGSCINGLIHVDRGKQAQLTIDATKRRRWYIVNGQGFIVWQNEQGGLSKEELKPGVGHTSQEGKSYYLEATTDCDVIELVDGK